MGIRLTRFPEYGVNIQTFSGTITADELVRYFGQLTDRGDTRWLDYLDPTLDLSRVDVASLPELKRTIAAKQQELFSDKPVVMAVVCSSNVCEQFLSFWGSYAASGDVHLAAPVMFSNIEAACDWLGLPEAAGAAVARAVAPDEQATVEGQRRR